MSLVSRMAAADPAERPRALPELALVVGLFLADKLARAGAAGEGREVGTA